MNAGSSGRNSSSNVGALVATSVVLDMARILRSRPLYSVARLSTMARGGLRYLAERAAHAVVVLLGISLIVFVLVHLTGDPTAAMLPPDAPAETRAAFRRHAGRDHPPPRQHVPVLDRAVAAGV